MSNKADQDRERIQVYLKALNQDELDYLLDEVLAEVRSRESDEIKNDILTHSQKLRLRRMIP